MTEPLCSAFPLVFLFYLCHTLTWLIYAFIFSSCSFLSFTYLLLSFFSCLQSTPSSLLLFVGTAVPSSPTWVVGQCPPSADCISIKSQRFFTALTMHLSLAVVLFLYLPVQCMLLNTQWFLSRALHIVVWAMPSVHATPFYCFSGWEWLMFLGSFQVKLLLVTWYDRVEMLFY